MTKQDRIDATMRAVLPWMLEDERKENRYGIAPPIRRAYLLACHAENVREELQIAEMSDPIDPAVLPACPRCKSPYPFDEVT